VAIREVAGLLLVVTAEWIVKRFLRSGVLPRFPDRWVDLGTAGRQDSTGIVIVPTPWGYL
jgi:hypothetical protein